MQQEIDTKKCVKPLAQAGVTAAVLFALVLSTSLGGCSNASSASGASSAPKQRSGGPLAVEEVDLNDAQLKSVEIGQVGKRVFSQQRTAIGSIDFNENLSVQVFSNYQGKILKAFAEIGDEVKKGQPLFTIDSPDLIQAESTLIAAAGVYELTTAALARDSKIFAVQGISQATLDQAVSDQQGAEGALKAARDAVRIFGKRENEIDRIVSTRKIDPALVVPSPISGRVTARMAQPGLLVQPGNAPAPYSVADVSTMWMIANVAESDSPLFHPGQEVRVKIMAFPDRDFSGKISRIGATVDPNTHTTLVRSEVRDPRHELRPGMLASYVISTGNPVASPAVPLDAVVREGDGTMSVWVTADRHHFVRRTVKLGLQQNGYDQILDGIKEGEVIVTKGAIFLSNMLTQSPS